MAGAFGIDARRLSRAQAAEQAVAAATAFISKMGIPMVTQAMHATPADVPMLVQETLETIATPIPREVAEAVWGEIFR